MSVPQVGQGAVAVVPTFKGFRSAVNKETDGAAKESARGFRSLWSKEGASSGRQVGQGFKQAFESESSGFSNKSLRELESNVSKASRTLSQARLKQQDQAGKVRVAEQQLIETQSKYASGSSQVLRATERLASETRKLETANESTARATGDLRDAQNRLATAADNAGDQLAESGRSGARKFSGGFREVFAGSFLGTTVAGLASSLVSNIGNAIGNGIRAAIEFGIGSIEIASDLNESVNAVAVSYGDLGDEVLALGDNSAKAFGLSKRELNGYATQFSSFVTTIAGEGGDVVGTLQTLIGRATDFASVMNLDVSEALTVFQSGLAGETEPLRRFGIDLSAASVEAYAYANGIGAAGTELTEAQKQQARYGLLLQETSKVQGDFANTSDELANKNRINAATWDDLQAKIGTAFLPVASAVASVIADDILPAIEGFVDEYGPELATAFEEVLPSIRSLAEEALPLLPGLFQSIADTLPAVISLITVLSPPIATVVGWLNGWFTAGSTLFALLAGDVTLAGFLEDVLAIPGPVGDILRSVASVAGGIGGYLGSAAFQVNQFATGVFSTVNGVILTFRNLPAQIGAVFAGAGSWLYNSGRSIIQGFIDGISSMFRAVDNAISGIVDWALGFFPNSPAKRGPLSGPGWNRLKQSGGAYVEQWTSGMARPDLSEVLDPYTPGRRASTPSSSSGAGGVNTVNQYITTQQTDPRLQVRQWGREAQKGFASS
ncbi:phage tail protein [Microbacterium kunmingense]|uniref:phage tail protein n=1 Tax=Microbacterium kunmingense TaxID=2915939 RepID=UPI003D72A4D3